jgi:predicted transcriptional regulator
MPQSLLEMAKDLVMAMIQAGALAPEDMQKELQKTHESLLELKSKEEFGEGNGVVSEHSFVSKGMSGSEYIDWRKSIKKYTIECLVCGASFKQLSVRHLRNHELDPRSYRQRFGIPRTQPLSAKDTTAMRKKIVQQSRPWEKAPTYVKAREQQANTSNGTVAKVPRAKKAAVGANA